MKNELPILSFDEVLEALAGGGIIVYHIGWSKSSVKVIRYGKEYGRVRSDAFEKLRYKECGLEEFHSEAHDVINSYSYYRATKKTPVDAEEFKKVTLKKIVKRLGENPFAR
jgi:hypothetical protein